MGLGHDVGFFSICTKSGNLGLLVTTGMKGGCWPGLKLTEI